MADIYERLDRLENLIVEMKKDQDEKLDALQTQLTGFIDLTNKKLAVIHRLAALGIWSGFNFSSCEKPDKKYVKHIERSDYLYDARLFDCEEPQNMQ